MMNLDLEEESSSSFNSFNTTISDKLGMVYHWQVYQGLPWFNGDPHHEKTPTHFQYLNHPQMFDTPSLSMFTQPGYLLHNHGIDGPNRYRWFTVFNSMVDLSMANWQCHNQRVT